MKMNIYDILAKINNRLNSSLISLNYDPTVNMIEQWSMLILECMSGPNRVFHGPHHIIEVTDDAEPIETIAGLYHDVVYYQVDQGFPKAVAPRMEKYVEVKDNQLFLVILTVNELLPKCDLAGISSR